MESSSQSLAKVTVRNRSSVIQLNGGSMSPTSGGTSSKQSRKAELKIDKYGFITNLDSHGKICSTNDNEHDSTKSPIKKSKKLDMRDRKYQRRLARREEKWRFMLSNWKIFTSKRNQKLRSRIRKGIPNSIRGEVWNALGRVSERMSEYEGLYRRLLEQSTSSSLENHKRHSDDENNSALSIEDDTSIVVQVIERDLNRTYPLHYLFCKSDSDRSDCDSDSDGSLDSSTNVDDHHSSVTNSQDVSNSALESNKYAAVDPLPNSASIEKNQSMAVAKVKGRCINLIDAKGGKASLRRVLRAYSVYDKEVGYCQGMNFIAAMFLTYISEEEAFWLLVYVMKEAPCSMRGLFGEHMVETQCVLFVADKLFAKFLPKLSHHFAKENVQVTMFATQWLLTLYSSSFPFEIVTRVWDCFLSDGWKIVYRVMLALLEQFSSDLLKLRFEDIMHYLKELPYKVDAESIMHVAFRIPLKRIHLQMYAREWNLKGQK